jgi:hypothetical protein
LHAARRRFRLLRQHSVVLFLSRLRVFEGTDHDRVERGKDFYSAAACRPRKCGAAARLRILKYQGENLKNENQESIIDVSAVLGAAGVRGNGDSLGGNLSVGDSERRPDYIRRHKLEKWLFAILCGQQ